MIIRSFLAAALIAAPTLAAAHSHDHADHDAASGSTEWAEINARMHADMDIEPTGDADVDFVRAMIPHHEGAVAMAEYVLANGTDPQVRALAEAVVAAQEAEIALMQEWLSARGLE